MLRAFFSAIFVTLFTIGCVLAAFPARLLDSSGDKVIDVARFWGRVILKVAGVDLKVEVRGRLEPGRPYVLMANHLSSMDIWAFLAAVPQRFRFIAKKQLARIPFLGWALWLGRFILVDRGNAVRARESIEQAKHRIREGASVLMFPEGTRARDGKMLPFKKGGFHLAIDAGVPIVPMAIWGTFESMPPGRLFPRAGVVRVIIGEPVPTDGLTGADRTRLLERVRKEVATMVAESAPWSVAHVLDDAAPAASSSPASA